MTVFGKFVQRGPVVHIGYEKAASTFLQKRVFPSLVGWTFSPINQTWRKELATNPSALWTDDGFRQEWSSDRIFSAEHILAEWSIDGPRLKNLALLVRKLECNPTLLIIIRRQDDWWSSTYRFKNRYWRWPNRVWEVKSTKHLDFLLLDNHLKQLGFSDLVYVPFERVVSDPNALSDVFGAEAIPSNLPLKTENESKPKDVLGYQFKSVQALLTRFPALERSLPHVSITIRDSLRSRLMARYRASNREISDRYGLHLDRYGYF